MPNRTLHIRPKLLRQLTAQEDNIMLIPHITIKIILSQLLDLIGDADLRVGLVAVVVLVGDVHLDVF